ncbi:hypothetical protein ACTHOQ_16195 [Solibacillus silvestris]|uniref:hypothetical protein n=1 Tax=Solibacillus silvestris TaxID=76853 RepID=UPI003F818F34
MKDDKRKPGKWQAGWGKEEKKRKTKNASGRGPADFPPESSALSEAEAPLRSKRLLKTFGGIALAIGIIGFFFTSGPSVETSRAATDALADQVSVELAAGTVLLSDDEKLAAQDYTIVHSLAEEETVIWVWDYAAEDGDYVQVLVNGTPISESFMIKHKPKKFTVAAVGTVEIKGIRDGGGGITYAVRYDVNGTSYFNTAPLNGMNSYELVRE